MAGVKRAQTVEEAGQRASQVVRDYIKEQCEKHGCGLDKTLKRLAEALDAEEQKVFNVKGTDQIIYSKKLVAHGPRLDAVKTALQLHDAFPSQRHEVEHSGVTILAPEEIQKRPPVDG